MSRNLLLCCCVVAIGLTACGGVSSPETLPNRPSVLHLEIPGDPDAIDVPWLMAIDALQAQGYTTEATAFADVAVPSMVMDQGDLDFASLSNLATWAAIEQGAGAVTVVDKSANAFLLMVSTAIQECGDLDGQRIAVSTLNAVPAAMLRAYIARHCPEVEPEYLVIRGGSNRLAGLLAGELDGAILDIDDLIVLGANQQDFYPLVIFADEFPDECPLCGVGKTCPHCKEQLR